MLLHHLMVISDGEVIINSLHKDKKDAVEKLVNAVRPGGEMDIASSQGSDIQNILNNFDSNNFSLQDTLAELKETLSEECNLDVHYDAIEAP